MSTPGVGDHAPGLAGTDHTGTAFDLATLRGHNVVIAFFPLAWTPV